MIALARDGWINVGFVALAVAAVAVAVAGVILLIREVRSRRAQTR